MIDVSKKISNIMKAKENRSLGFFGRKVSSIILLRIRIALTSRSFLGNNHSLMKSKFKVLVYNKWLKQDRLVCSRFCASKK